jgi:hypothetical protein
MRAPSVSAGALHAVDAVLVRHNRAFHYNRDTDQLDVLAVPNAEALVLLTTRVGRMLSRPAANVLVLVGDLPFIDARYHEPISLLLRDSGAMTQTLALTAEAFSIGFCPLGILGGEVVDALGESSGGLVAVGAAVVGNLGEAKG